MSRGFDDEAIASARGCICGGCDECLRAQGYDPHAPEEVECEKCGALMGYEERFEEQGYALCKKCEKEVAEPEEARI